MRKVFASISSRLLITKTMTLVMILSLSCGILYAAADSELVVGEFYYTYGDNESLAQAKEMCEKNATRRALESAMIYVHSEIRVGVEGLKNLDVHALAAGCLKNVKLLEESVEDRTIYCRVQGIVDVADLEKKLWDAVSSQKIKPRRKVRISFYNASIDENQDYERDDTKSAPDAYVMVEDRHGNRIFDSGHSFLSRKMYKPLFKNRNNYNPRFDNVSFMYTFTEMDYLLIHLMDWDGLEGFMGRKNSPDDPIGSPFHVRLDYPLGKRWVMGKGWKLEMEIMECH